MSGMGGAAAQQLAQGLAAMGLEVPAAAQEKLLAYAALLEKWNKTYSLTALRGADKAVSHHLLDSLAVLPHVPAGTLLDVGSGGGMPGMPGVPGMGGGRRPARQQASKKKGRKGVSGNPAKRAAASAPAEQPAAPAQPAVDEFGLPISGAPSSSAMDEFQLPPELAKMFDQNKPKF